jgi:hypothetical protein
VYGFRQLKPSGNRGEYYTAIVRHIAIDMDAQLTETGELLECHQEMQRFSEALKEGNISHAVVFSGGGYHFYIKTDRPYTIEDESSRSNLSQAIRQWVQGHATLLNLTSMDFQVVGDLGRVMRTPGTFSVKRKRWCVGLPTNASTMPLEDVLRASQGQSKGVHFTVGQGVPLTVITEQRAFSESDEITITTEPMLKGVCVIPCMMTHAVQNRNPEHLARVYLAQYLSDYFKYGRPNEQLTEADFKEVENQIVAFIEGLEWIDFDENVTRRHVSGIVRNYDYAQSCTRIFNTGYCIGKCSYWSE